MVDITEQTPAPEPATAIPYPGRNGGINGATGVRRRKRTRNTRIVAIATACIVAASAFWLFGFRLTTVVSNSMAPTFSGTAGRRDQILCGLLPYFYRDPKRWEIIVFNAPKRAENGTYGPFETGGESGLTIKRLVGLPDERLAIRNGDIWTRPLAGGAYVRAVKPDRVQRALWISVYGEDFNDPDPGIFRHYWREDGNGEWRLGADRILRAAPAAGAYILAFKPMVRAGTLGDSEMPLPGIPDRYVLAQEVFFHCANPACRNYFSLDIDSQKILGRCPACKTVNYEPGIVDYTFRSGLAEIGPYAAGDVKQGDQKHFRTNSYYFVPDLRLRAECMLASPDSICRFALAHGDEADVLGIAKEGMTVNGVPVPGVAVKTGEWLSVEFYRADGAVRLFVNGGDKPVFDRILSSEPIAEESGEGIPGNVAMEVEGGEVAFRSIRIDRDIYYFSGEEMRIANYLNAMEKGGEIDIPQGTFLPLGDNTTVSLDGRSWGPVEDYLLRGVALRIWRPAERAGWIAQP